MDRKTPTNAMNKADIQLSDLYHSLTIDKQIKFLKSLSKEAFNEFYYSDMFLLPYQRIPEGDWRYSLFLAGRGVGKTVSSAQWIVKKAKDPKNRVAIVAPTFSDLGRVMIPAIIDRCPPDDKPKYISTPTNLLRFNDGRTIECHSYDTSSMRGSNISHLWIDEIVKASDGIEDKILQKFQEEIDPAVRIGQSQIILSTTPKPMRILKEWVERFKNDDPLIILRTAKTEDNPYLSKTAKSALISAYGGTRVGRQELNGELLMDVPGALWNHYMIDSNRVTRDWFRNNIGLENVERVVIGVDPTVADGTDKNDLCGITAAAIYQNHAYVLEDASLRASPNVWAETVVRLYNKYKASAIIIEVNNGGNMNELVLRSVSRNINIVKIHAKQAKITRAEPVAALAEQKKISHVGFFPELEEEMLTFNGSPKSSATDDRLDSMVYAIRNLMLDNVYTRRDFSSIGSF